jgi:hypothetical protein
MVSGQLGALTGAMTSGAAALGGTSLMHAA